MATWEDGPEYAPLEPPAEFRDAGAPPLSQAAPPPQPPDAPGERPYFGEPQQQTAPLATLVPAIGGEQRDPHQPFEVDSDAMTQSGGSGGAWGAAHWRPPTGPPAGVPGPAPWGPPAGAPVGLPTDPLTLRSAPASAPNGLPAPGTPGWFGPGPAAPAPQQPPPSVFRATPPGAIIVLAVSIFWIVAPVTFAIGFVLSARARYARRRILTAFTVTSVVVLLIATIDTVLNYGTFGDWYRLLCSWTLIGSLLMIVLILAFVSTELKTRGGTPGGGNPGGYPQIPRDYQPRHDQPGHDQPGHDRQQWPPAGR